MKETKIGTNLRLAFPKIPGGVALLGLSLLAGPSEGAQQNQPPRPQARAVAARASLLDRQIENVRVSMALADELIEKVAITARVNILVNWRYLGIERRAPARYSDKRKTLRAALEETVQSAQPKSKVVVEELGGLVVVSNRSHKEEYLSLLHSSCTSRDTAMLGAGSNRTLLQVLELLRSGVHVFDWELLKACGVDPETRVGPYGEQSMVRIEGIAALLAVAVDQKSKSSPLIAERSDIVIVGEAGYTGALAACLTARAARNTAPGINPLDRPFSRFNIDRLKGHDIQQDSLKGTLEKVCGAYGFKLVADWDDLKAKNVEKRGEAGYLGRWSIRDVFDYVCILSSTSDHLLDYTCNDKTVTFFVVKAEALRGQESSGKTAPAKSLNGNK